VDRVDGLDHEEDRLEVVSPASPELLVETLRVGALRGPRSPADPWHDGDVRPTG
jgi:hypothetical protein